MRAEIVYTPKNEFKEARIDLEERIKEVKLSGFEPNFILMFLTDGTFKDWKRYNEFFREGFPDVQMLGCVVEGYAARDEIWTRGVVALLGEFEGEVEVYFESGDKVEEVCNRLGKKIRERYDSILAMFPVFYFPGRLEFARLFINDRLYYRRYRNQETLEGKKSVLGEYSKYLEDHFIFPIDKVLKYLSESTGGEIPIMGMNLMPLEGKVGTPIILANYEEIGRGVAAMCFKGEVNAVYHDIYPERGNSFEETVEIIKEYFSNVEEVEVVKAGIAIGEINGMTPMEFLRMKRVAYERIGEGEFLDKVEKGKLQTVTPYGLAFVNKNNFSSLLFGLVNSPVNIYPSLIELDNFEETGIFVGEIFREGTKKFAEITRYKKRSGAFDLFLFDMDMIPSFKSKIYKVVAELTEHSPNKLGLFVAPPSAYLPYVASKSLVEIDRGYFVTGSGSSALLEF
ncbi:hypothetical protein DRP07_11780 [Archaeoglobales archaeon]|nr:MAG: hypothetical protein DRP07_11780 [Archaeoglobales archaeon]